MTQQNENRRVRMTKRLIKDALLELMEEQDLINISVTSICETADIHRSTFYKYYKEPSDLLQEMVTDFMERIPTPPQNLDQKNEDALLAMTTDFFDFIQDNKKMMRILFNESYGNIFTAQLVNHLLNGYVPVNESTDKLTDDFRSIYIANGVVGMMREWIQQDFPLNSKQIAEMMYSLSRKISQK